MRGVCTRLTTEERDVVILSARRLTNEEIAERLGMSVIKVKALMHQASIKLGAHTRLAAVFFAVMGGHIGADEVFSLDELAEYLDGLAPDVLNKIAQVLWQMAGRGILPTIDKGFLHIDKEQDTILTKGERDVLRFVGQGLTNKEIAEKLFLSDFAVRNTLNRACFKLGARCRGDAIMLALGQKAVQLSDVIPLDKIVWCLAQCKPETLEKLAELLNHKTERECPRIAA